MLNRIELAKYFAELGFKVGAEIGVNRGLYAQTMFENNPGLKLYLVDNWASERRRSNMAEALDRTNEYNAEVMEMTSLEAAQQFQSEALDFVFIDAGHTYKDVKEDLEAWTPKVRKGGIVSGHDYYEFPSGRGGVIPAVNEYIAEHGYALHIIPWDKTQSVDNRQPCWYFRR